MPSLKSVIRRAVPKSILELRRAALATKPLQQRSCPICSYHGWFGHYGRPPRLDAECLSCGSLERHRLFWLWFQQNADTIVHPVLHFAPEPILRDRLRDRCASYKTADLYADANLKLNLERIELPDESQGTLICNHVLEHVNDKLALAELNRILTKDGALLASFPLVEGWDKTYENDAITAPHDRDVHFGQHDHVRFYGKDVRDRFRAAGFTHVEEFTAEGPDVITYGLQRGEKLFICRK